MGSKEQIDDLRRKNKNLRGSLNHSIDVFKRLTKFLDSQLSSQCSVDEIKSILKGFDE